jgi:hypothetical protein
MSQHGMFNAVEEAAMARRIGSGEFIDADKDARQVMGAVTQLHPEAQRAMAIRQRDLDAEAALGQDPNVQRQRQLRADLAAIGR